MTQFVREFQRDVTSHSAGHRDTDVTPQGRSFSARLLSHSLTYAEERVSRRRPLFSGKIAEEPRDNLGRPFRLPLSPPFNVIRVLIRILSRSTSGRRGVCADVCELSLRVTRFTRIRRRTEESGIFIVSLHVSCLRKRKCVVGRSTHGRTIT